MPRFAFCARVLPCTALALCAAWILSGCSIASHRGLLTPYRVAVPQGNYLDAAMLEQVKPGMSPEQVQFALGTPLLKAWLQPDAWHYVFRLQYPNGQVDLRRSTIYFSKGRVERIETDALPAEDQGPEPLLPTPSRRAGRYR